MSGDSAAPPESSTTESRITLDLLDAVHADRQVSQRTLANRLNIALGLTNAYLKRCVSKGLLKVQKIPPNRYAYYLTPRGFAEKSRLTADYLAYSFQFYRRARNECDELLAQAAGRGVRRVALVGAGELAEIALLCAMQHAIEIVGVIDSSAVPGRFRHVRLVQDIDSLAGVEVVLITDLKDPQRSFETISRRIDAGCVLTPKLLKVSRAAASEGQGGSRF